MTDEWIVTCKKCGTILEADPARPPCPNCGCAIRVSTVAVSDGLQLGDKIGMKHNRPGTKKPVYESVTGDDIFRKTGEMNKLSREIDRENDRYREKIVNPLTGEVIREVDEPLSAHRDRGTPRKKRPNEPGT
jgi:hypothetical protein